MLQHLGCRVSLHRVHVEHPQNKIFGSRGYRVPIASGEGNFSLPDAGKNVLRGVIWPRGEGGGTGWEGGQRIDYH